MRALVVAIALLPGVAGAEIVAKGVRGGVGLLGVEQANDNMGSGSTSLTSSPSFAGGAFLRNRFTSSFSLQVELDIALKRFAEETCPMSGCMSTGATIALWYLELPVLLRFDLLPGDTRFHLDVGPQLVLGLGGTQTPAIGPAQPLDLVPGNLGIVLGAGIDVRAGVGHVLFDVRYARWLAPIADSGGDGSKVSPSHQLYASVGYAFP